jgi:hypothetical protein
MGSGGKVNEQAWIELLEAAKTRVSQMPENFRWVAPNRVAFFNTRQVQARFVQEPHRYSIFFERFGAELGHFNYEPIPGSGEPKQTIVTILAEISEGETFWRLADGQTLKSDVLARRVIDRLPSFHDEYGRSVSNIDF